MGTIYTNKNKNTDALNTYEVVAFEENKIFELATKHGSYSVRYTYKPLDKNSTELEYYEFDELGEINQPFTQDVLEKLKEVLEQ